MPILIDFDAEWYIKVNGKIYRPRARVENNKLVIELEETNIEIDEKENVKRKSK